MTKAPRASRQPAVNAAVPPNVVQSQVTTIATPTTSAVSAPLPVRSGPENEARVHAHHAHPSPALENVVQAHAHHALPKDAAEKGHQAHVRHVPENAVRAHALHARPKHVPASALRVTAKQANAVRGLRSQAPAEARPTVRARVAAGRKLPRHPSALAVGHRAMFAVAKRLRKRTWTMARSLLASPAPRVLGAARRGASVRSTALPPEANGAKRRAA